jgi:protein TonB
VHALSQRRVRPKPKSTIYQGFVVSLALHSTLALPFVLHGAAPRRVEPVTLVVEIDGVVADNQTEEKVLRETAGEPKQEEPDREKPKDTPPKPTPEATPAKERPADVAAEPTPAPPEPIRPPAPAPAPAEEKNAPAIPMKAVGTSPDDILGAEQQQNAQTIKIERDAEVSRLREYARQLSKRVQANLVYPQEGRQADLQGTTTVSFTILPNGQIQPETLRITVSSGQLKLDASALETIRRSAPFGSPPIKMTVAIAVAFGQRH